MARCREADYKAFTLGVCSGESLNNLKIQFPNFKIWNIIKQIFFLRIM